MQSTQNAARAYAASASHRGQKEQEADVFRRANAALRQAGSFDQLGSVKALADNERLWSAVIDLLRDPDNPLPAGLRASIISVGLTVQREMQRPAPDIEFLITINDNVAAGLSGQS